MNMFMGWTLEQWMWAAAVYPTQLPLIADDVMRACVVQDWWFEHRTDDPEQPRIVLVDLFNNPVAQTLPWAAKTWAIRVMSQAAKQSQHPLHPSVFVRSI